MKNVIALLLASTIAVSLVACGQSKPTEDEVIAAIQAGTLTMQDAINKDYVDEQWAEDYYEASAVPAPDKAEAYMVDDFETETIDGEVFTKSDLSPVTFISFLNPSTDEGKAQYKALDETYDEVISSGGDILVVNVSNEDSDLFKHSKFKVVSYNDSLKTALGTLSDMVNEHGAMGSWNVNGSFLSTWYSIIDVVEFVDKGKYFLKTDEQSTEDADSTI